MVRVVPAGTVPSAHGNAPVHAPVLETNVSPGGVGSSTTTAVASDGPGFVTVIVKVRFVPAVTFGGPLFVSCTSAAVMIAVVSVALLLSRSGSGVSPGAATLAVLLSVPVALAATVPVAVKVTDPPAARSTVVTMSPVPPPAPQVPPVPGLHVHVTPISSGGNVSVTPAPTTAVGPAFATVIV